MTLRSLLPAAVLLLTPLARAAEPPPDLLKTDLMVVVAHPDDEGMAAAVMTRYALGEGKTVACIHATRGEGGGNEVGTQLGPALGQLREAELRDAVTRMGVKHLYFLDEEDWAYTESAAATLQKWGHDDALGKLVRLVRNLRPEVIVTFMPAPSGGQHGHHQTAGLLATEAFEVAADSAAFPDQMKREGLRPWQPKRLYYVGEYVGAGPQVSVKVDGKAPDGRAFAEIAAEAMSRHSSQGFGGFAGLRGTIRPAHFTLARTALPPDTQRPDDLLKGTGSANGLLALFEPETYRVPRGGQGKVRLTLFNPTQNVLSPYPFRTSTAGWDLDEIRKSLPREIQPGERLSPTFTFTLPEKPEEGSKYDLNLTLGRGIEDIAPENALLLKTTVVMTSPIQAEVQPLPAIARFREWTRANKVEPFATGLPSWVPLAAGQEGIVRVTVLNQGGDQVLRVVPQLPPDWARTPRDQTVTVKSNESETLEFRVTPPAGMGAIDVPFKVRVFPAVQNAEPITGTEGLAQVVPYAEVSRMATAPMVDGDLAEWAGAGEIRVRSSNVVQGQFRDSADGSAVAHLGYDDRNLYVAVRVTDDVVVSNIAPDDIKAHWRSDSVELTVDPHPRSEATLTTFKVGIFPWDTAGNVRAARDADSNPGPIEETAPGMELASKRIPDGYIIETAIPWSSIGAEPKSGLRLGFNLLLYDGDQKDARVGDGIGEGRLAWAPRPGVWGRPEQWGEIRLK